MAGRSVKALDTNILVYAEIRSGPHHKKALALLDDTASSGLPWALVWPTVYEFLRIVTHPRGFHSPVLLETERVDLNAILSSPSLVLLRETDRHREVLDDVLERSQVTGNLVHDAHIVTICLENGVDEIVTADRDFARFSGITVTNPLR